MSHIIDQTMVVRLEIFSNVAPDLRMKNGITLYTMKLIKENPIIYPAIAPFFVVSNSSNSLYSLKIKRDSIKVIIVPKTPKKPK